MRNKKSVVTLIPNGNLAYFVRGISDKEKKVLQNRQKIVRENLDNDANVEPFDSDVFKVRFNDATTNVENIFDDVDSNVVTSRNQKVKKNVVIILEDVDADNSSQLSRFV